MSTAVAHSSKRQSETMANVECAKYGCDSSFGVSLGPSGVFSTEYGHLYNALSAYSNIFFDEAVTAIQSKDATPWTREILSLYLQKVFLRLDDGRREQVKALLKQLNLPIHFGFGVE